MVLLTCWHVRRRRGQCPLSVPCRRKREASLTDVQTSGLTLAARLSDDPKISVLVLEAGPANLDDPALRRSPLIDPSGVGD